MASPLPTRRLGADGPELSAVGFGAWAIGGGDWCVRLGAAGRRATRSPPSTARSSSASTGSTPPACTGWATRRRWWRAPCAGVAERPLVFTKCGMVWHDQPDGVPRPNLRPEEIRRGCDDSLRRLGVERIDLFQFHWPDANTGTPVEESWGVMADLVAAGKVRWAGVSNFDVPLLERCEPIHHVDSLQPPFNAIDRAAAADLLPWCAAHGTGVIVYSPMMSGLLTGRFSHERAAALDEADWRREFPPFVEPALSRNLALADALRPVAARHETSVAAVAVAWTLTWPGVSAAIVGARSPEQVDGWIGAADIALSAADLEEIAAAITTTEAGAGPVSPDV